MKNYIFLLIGFLLLFVNFFYIGVLKNNEKDITELFVKHRPTSKTYFLSDKNRVRSLNVDFKQEESLYAEFITSRNIEDKSKSFLPLILIQLMLSCFTVSFFKIDFKRKLVLLGSHFFILLVGSFPIIAEVFSANNTLQSALIGIGIILLNYFIAYFFVKSKTQPTPSSP